MYNKLQESPDHTDNGYKLLLYTTTLQHHQKY